MSPIRDCAASIPAVARLADSSSRSGFTLVELMVVLGIVLVLSGLLLPAIHQVRSAARAVVCGSNVRTLGLFSTAWSMDNSGWTLPCSFPSVLRGMEGWPDAAEAEKKLLTCPTLRHELPSRSVTYGMNLKLVKQSTWGPGFVWWTTHGKWTLSQVGHARTFMMAEVNGDYAYLAGYPSAGTAMWAAHRGRSNILRLDGSVAVVVPFDLNVLYFTTYPAEPPE